jgi:PAS domain S-box-containing protein
MSTVWLVDDSDLEREVARRALVKRHEVVEFVNGEDVLERIGVGDLPDVLVIDYKLPNLSGLEVTRHLRRRLSQAELPVLVLSSTHKESEDVVDGLEAGANDYLLKPFFEKELLARVAALAEAKRLRERADLAERSLRRLLQFLPDAFIAIDLNGRITFVNHEAERILGQDWAALLAQPIGALVPRLARLHEQDPGPARMEINIGDRIYEPAFGRLVIEEQLGETITVTLRDVTESVQAIDRRDRFLAMLGHELRNPLAPILAAVQLLQRSRGDANMVERAGTIIHRQVERMMRIVDDLLDVSRVSRGRIEIRPEPVNVAVAIEQAIESTQPLVEARKHTLVWHPPAKPMWVQADPLRFEQMLTNLLTNAAKYTGERGEIQVQVRTDGDAIVVSVKDNGIGIPAESLDSIFELFVQIDDSLSRSEGGLGIGLPLVRQLATMHGGSVHALSAGPGKGSELILRLPAAKTAGVRAPSSPPASAKVPRRVLLVDDNEDIVELIAEALTMGGHEVRTSTDGNRALEVAREFRPDVAFLDIGLPGADGYEVARQLRAQLPDALLIAVTGYGQPEDKKRARAAGFDQHLIKPVSLEVVETLLASKKLRLDTGEF